MNGSWSLRLLDPIEDADLFRQAYAWRPKAKAHAQPDRMPFEEFSADRSDQVTIGLFNGELRAVYFLHETEPGNYQAHFTSQRYVPRSVLLAGAAQVARDFFAAGASEIHAWVTPRNTALTQFLLDLGFVCVEQTQFCCERIGIVSTMPTDRNQRSYVKYSLKVNEDRSQRQEAKLDHEPDDQLVGNNE